MSILLDTSFMDACLALVAIGWIERFAIPMMPEHIVGPEGWLLTTAK